MKRQPITKDEVFTIADEIVDMGLNPTQRAVMRRVGGSFGTVGTFLDEWRRTRRAANENPRMTAPDQLIDAVQIFANEIWAKSVDLAAARLRETQKRLEGEQATLDEERIDMLGLIRDMENAATAQETRITALAGALGDAEAVTANLRDKRPEPANEVPLPRRV